MKNSLKKLSMMAMLGVVIGSNLNCTAKHSYITVNNLPQDQSIAAKVRFGNSAQSPDANGKYDLQSDATYCVIKRTTGTKGHKGSDEIISNTTHIGSDFEGKTTWDIATNQIS